MKIDDLVSKHAQEKKEREMNPVVFGEIEDSDVWARFTVEYRGHEITVEYADDSGYSFDFPEELAEYEEDFYYKLPFVTAELSERG